jgi:hypothetical protein
MKFIVTQVIETVNRWDIEACCEARAEEIATTTAPDGTFTEQASFEIDTVGPSPDADSRILDELIDILYPLDEYRDHQWNGGDVCEAVAAIVHRERPDAHLRQPVEPPIFGVPS